MKILLVNDDGIDSLGIKKLEEVLLNYGEVFVFAPAIEQSAKSASVSAYRGIDVKKIDDHHFKVFGTPVDCLECGLSFILDIDLVVSGVNNGWNLASDIMYSGTCGACLAALFAKKKAIAFSIKNKDYFNLIESLTQESLDYVFKNNLLSNKYYLNINLPVDNFKGLKITKVYQHVSMEYKIIEKIDNHYKIANIRPYNFKSNDFDSNATIEGYISISPIGQSCFNALYYNKLKKLNK